jgi:multidrug efflux pump subunit AcrB
MLLAFALITATLGLFYVRLPTSFLPEEDQGVVMVNVQLTPEATIHRTLKAVKEIEAHFESRPGVRFVSAYPGFGFSGSGQNVALVFVMMKDWGERPAGATAQGETALVNDKLSAVGELAPTT